MTKATLRTKFQELANKLKGRGPQANLHGTADQTAAAHEIEAILAGHEDEPAPLSAPLVPPVPPEIPAEKLEAAFEGQKGLSVPGVDHGTPATEDKEEDHEKHGKRAKK